MDIILMHKNNPVAKLIFTDGGYFSKLEGFYNKDLMPPGTRVQDMMAQQRLKNWFDMRCVPKERENYIKLISEAGINTNEQFYFRNNGLGLNDCYWIRTMESMDTNIVWEDVNFFQNNYSDYVGQILIDPSYKAFSKNFNSPDLVTHGTTMKRWEQDPITLKSTLIKFGTDKYDGNEVFIECAASEIAEALGVNHVKYYLVEREVAGGYMLGCACENFCSENAEFISAQYLMVEPGNVGKNGMLNYAKRIGEKKNIDKMLVFDYIISNPDRNVSNFGFLRDADTFDSLGLAPLFDHGKSLWIDYATNGVNKSEESKPFESIHSKQIELVDDFSWIDFDRFELIDFKIGQCLKQSTIPENIQEQIVKAVLKRINNLKEIASKKNSQIPVKSDMKESTTPSKITLSESSEGFGF